jgi:translation initiation factor IF-3
MFRGREVTHPERGTAILDRLAEELAELGVVEQRPIQEGRNMTMMMAPSKAVLSGKADGEEASDEVFTEGEQGDVASTALQSPLDEAAVEAVETPEARDGATAHGDADQGKEAAASGDAEDEQGSSDTADASADTAVS